MTKTQKVIYLIGICQVVLFTDRLSRTVLRNLTEILDAKRLDIERQKMNTAK